MSSRRSWASIALSAALLLACKSGSGGGEEQVTGTIKEHLAAGMTALEAGIASQGTDSLLLAANELSAAAALVGRDNAATPAEVDRARAFGGLARVALLARPYTDAAPGNGLNYLGDILDGYGLGGTPFQRSHLDTISVVHCTPVYQYYSTYQRCELNTLSPDSPRTAELQAFLAEELHTALTGAVALLDAVTPAFQADLAVSGKTLDVDHTDVLFASAIAHAALAQIEIQQAYDLDVIPDELQANLQVDTYGFDDFLAEYPSFLKLKSAAALPSARQHALAAIGAARHGLAALKAETDDQANDLVRLSTQVCTYGPDPINPTYYTYRCTTQYNAAEKIAEADAALADVENVLKASGQYAHGQDTPETDDDFTIVPDRFFAGMDLRAMIPAAFTYGREHDRPGMFPDPTFGGFLVSAPFDPNADADADGSPDVFGYTSFSDALLGGAPFYTMGWTPQGDFSGWCSFATGAHTFVWTRTERTYGQYGPVTVEVTYTGTYAYLANVLTLTFGGPGPLGAAKEEIEASSFDESSFAVSRVTYRDATSAIVPAYGEYWTR